MFHRSDHCVLIGLAEPTGHPLVPPTVPGALSSCRCPHTHVLTHSQLLLGGGKVHGSCCRGKQEPQPPLAPHSPTPPGTRLGIKCNGPGFQSTLLKIPGDATVQASHCSHCVFSLDSTSSWDGKRTRASRPNRGFHKSVNITCTAVETNKLENMTHYGL